ncbi:MAG: HD domain-containing protein [Bacteroidetes bacterium]|nr:MAG: HD domain-containing protein [Bacteroidota bacterium]
MDKELLQKAEQHVRELLEKGLTPDHKYHNVAHTLNVRKAARLLAEHYKLSEEEKEILELAALFHDTGFTRSYQGHEDISKELARQFLEGEGYPPERIQKVLDCIEVTKLGVEPRTLPQKILKDADFNNFENGDYLQKSEDLRHEWKVFCRREMSDREWLENSLEFWESHQFHTEEAESLFGDDKKQNLKALKKKIKKAKKKEAAANQLIAGNRSAQMLFKTSLRNHIDLTNIADNKANIMLSINALIITITMPLLAANLRGNMFLLIPTAILLTTCVLSIIFATLATRPIKTHGSVDVGKIGKEPTNLFFFGNFYKMTLEEYQEGIRRILADEKLLEQTISMDLFYLGKALGAKFSRLRTCYSIFMVGMTLTVIAFALTFFLTSPNG